MPKTKKKSRSKQEKAIEALEHQDRRPNIPTSELASFVAEDEERPGSLLYPRDTSLDPQLVWKGKDEQDREDLAVPVVPVYIQEKIHPLALIESLRDTAAPGEPEPEQILFEQFNGLDSFEAKLDFYQHEANWTNRMILGDSLLVMTSLAQKEGLRGKVQMMYVDPPYGIKFGSNWQVSTRKRDVKDGKVEDAAREPEVIRAFRDTWELGIHSYLAYLRDRFTVALELLTETGSIFVQIGDENVHLVRSVLDEVFGSENHVVTIVIKKKGGQRSGLLDPVNDYVLWYSKTARETASAGGIKFRQLFEPRGLDADTLAEFRFVELPDGSQHSITAVPNGGGEGIDYSLRPSQLFSDHPGARLFASNPLTGGGIFRTQAVPYTYAGKRFSPGRGQSWKHSAITDDDSPSGMDRIAWSNRLIEGDSTWRFKRYLDDFPFKLVSNWWDGLGGASNPVYVVQTNPEIVKRCILMTTDPGDLVLDPTCGSGTTAYVAELWGRRWITIDTSRVALALARTRLMTTRFPFYLLLDSPKGSAKETEIIGMTSTNSHETRYNSDVRKGFVCRRAAHVTSSSIANCSEIEEGMSRDQIEEAIRRVADVEVLFDQPYRDPGTVRVTGPFTVESLAPHRVLSTEEERPATERAGEQETAGSFTTMILNNLRKAGVQNTKRGERLLFDRLEPFAGRWIQAAGEYTDSDGEKRRVAISLGPEHGAVGPQQIREAAKEAVQGVGFDLLLVLGFAFDPHASEAAEAVSPDGGGTETGFVAERRRQFGKLPVLLVRMNPDLALGDELLKKTGTGNLFMVFGEPDIEIRTVEGGKLVVEIRGLDIYDPTTGEIRSSSTDDIACWFLDTAYDGESFFVRQAYFTGADEPYEKLKRALRAEIDPDAWAELYRTESRPFAKPATGRIAIKVINHYGDEVLKVFEVAE